MVRSGANKMKAYRSSLHCSRATLKAEAYAYLIGESNSLAPMRRAVVGQSGPLADAVREFLKLGTGHDGPCNQSLSDGSCSLHVRLYNKRRAALLKVVTR
jgi:hypothetical protein